LRKADAIGKTPYFCNANYGEVCTARARTFALVQKVLGHASLSTTMIYTHIVDDDMEAAMRLLNSYHEMPGLLPSLSLYC
jgi:integrase